MTLTAIIGSVDKTKYYTTLNLPAFGYSKGACCRMRRAPFCVCVCEMLWWYGIGKKSSLSIWYHVSQNVLVAFVRSVVY